MNAAASSSSSSARRLEDRAGHGQLGQTAQRLLGDADDPRADPVLETLAGGLDDAGHVHAQRERRLGRHGRDSAAAPGHVAEVERAGGDPHQRLTRPGRGHVGLADLDHVLGLTEPADPHCSHK